MSVAALRFADTFCFSFPLSPAARARIILGIVLRHENRWPVSRRDVEAAQLNLNMNHPSAKDATPKKNGGARTTPKYPGIRVTCNGNQLVTQYVETRVTEGGVFYPITPSTEGGEIYQQSYAQGELNVFGKQKIAIECEGEHAAQGGATAYSVAGRRTVNFTSGQGIVYAMEQYYHAP